MRPTERRRVLSMTSEGPGSFAEPMSADASLRWPDWVVRDLAMTADELEAATDGYVLDQREQR